MRPTSARTSNEALRPLQPQPLVQPTIDLRPCTRPPGPAAVLLMAPSDGCGPCAPCLLLSPLPNCLAHGPAPVPLYLPLHCATTSQHAGQPWHYRVAVLQSVCVKVKTSCHVCCRWDSKRSGPPPAATCRQMHPAAAGYTPLSTWSVLRRPLPNRQRCCCQCRGPALTAALQARPPKRATAGPGLHPAPVEHWQLHPPCCWRRRCWPLRRIAARGWGPAQRAAAAAPAQHPRRRRVPGWPGCHGWSEAS